MSLPTHSTVATALTISAALLLPVQLSAQVADRRATTIEEVIVTARKVEESLQDTPVSVAAFSAEDLEMIGATQPRDIADFTPGLRIQKQSGSQDNYAMAIRGVSSGETALAIDPTVGVYIDGVYIARSTGLAFDIVDLQRIEVLRGPQGTLFGRNTIGGAINIITKKPAGELQYKQLAGTGNRGREKYQFSIDTPRIGAFAAKFSALKQMHHGQLRNQYTGERLGDRTANAQRLAVLWTPAETVSVDLILDQSFRDSNSLTSHLSAIKDVYSDPTSNFYGGPFYSQAEAASGPDRRSRVPLMNTDTNETNSDIRSAAIIVDWQLGDSLAVKSISSHREWRSKARGTDFGSFPVQTEGDVVDLRSGNPSLVPAGTFVSLFSATRDNVHRQTTQEFQLLGDAFDERLNYQVGLYFFEERASEINPQQFVLPTNFITFAASGVPPVAPGTSATWLGAPFAYTTESESWAAYGQGTYNLMESLDLTVGLRYTVDDKAGTLTNNLDGGGASTASAEDDWSNLNPSVTIDYRWSEQLSSYARVATGYRSGGFNVRAQTTSAYTTPFNEENILSWELGIKSDLFDRSLRVNASLFRIEYEDRQIAQFEAGSGGASSNIVNAGESETHGFEVEALWIPTPGLRITAAYGYLDVEYTEFISGPVDRATGFSTGSNQDISDLAVKNLYAPTHTSALAVEYRFAPWTFGQFTMRVDSTFADSISFHPQLNLYDETEAVTLLNARLSLADIPAGKDGRLKLTAWGKNLENKTYRQFGIDFGVLGLAISNYGELRTWGVDLIYEFGGS